MLVYDNKVTKYLLTNPIVDKFLKEVDTTIETHHKTHLPNLAMPLVRVELGNKFIRISSDGSCWGFISRVDGDLKGSPIKKGDLLKPASWKSPAKHARGNIIDGTAKYGVYGPEYLR